MYEKYWGEALLRGRLKSRMTREELREKLCAKLLRELSFDEIARIENGGVRIDDELFDVWCSVFSVGKIGILKGAQLLAGLEGLSEEELLQKIKSEVEYRFFWRPDQEAQEGNDVPE